MCLFLSPVVLGESPIVWLRLLRLCSFGFWFCGSCYRIRLEGEVVITNNISLNRQMFLLFDYYFFYCSLASKFISRHAVQSSLIAAAIYLPWLESFVSCLRLIGTSAYYTLLNFFLRSPMISYRWCR